MIVNPPASCSTLTGAADVANNGLITVEVLPGRRAAGVQPRVRSRASHGIPWQIAFMRRVLSHARIFHPSVVHSHRYRVLRWLVRLACRRLGVARGRHGDLRHRRSVHITVDPAEKVAADFVFRVPSWHHLREPTETLLSPLVEHASV